MVEPTVWFPVADDDEIRGPDDPRVVEAPVGVMDVVFPSAVVPATANALLPIVAPPTASVDPLAPVRSDVPPVDQSAMPLKELLALYWIVPDAPPGDPLPPPPPPPPPIALDGPIGACANAAGAQARQTIRAAA